MKTVFISALLSFSMVCVPLSSAFAGFFYNDNMISSFRSWDYMSDNQWVYFGGCEENNKTACVYNQYNNYLIIGDYGVKQGVYALNTPKTDHTHGKVVLKYEYRFMTEESSGNTTDVGYIKLKDITAGGKILHLQTLTAKDATEEFQKKRILLPTGLANHKFQLVFEVQNDAERLSTLSVETISLRHLSEPVIRGTVYEEAAGKLSPVEGLTLKLQNRKRTKTFYETKTTSNLEDNYTFWPVPDMTKLVVVASYKGQEKVVNVKKMKYGDYNADVNFTFE